MSRGHREIRFESDWMAPEELRRLLGEQAELVAGVEVEPGGGNETTRDLDPQVAAAVVSATSTVVVPFLTVLAQRLFAADRRARLVVADSSASTTAVEVVVPPDGVTTFEVAPGSGPLVVRISVARPAD